MVTTALASAAATWGVLMALSPLLQIRTIVARRSSHGVSIGYFVVLVVGFVLWLAYGLSSNNLALVIPNTVALAVTTATIAVVARFRGVASEP
jgi:uncharacterized protein with PQ loop repeat